VSTPASKTPIVSSRTSAAVAATTKALSAARSAELMKETIENEIKRGIHISKRDNHAKNNRNNDVKKTPTPTASQQLQLQQKGGAVASTSSQNLSTPGTAKKFYVSKQANSDSTGATSATGTVPSPGILNRKSQLSTPLKNGTASPQAGAVGSTTQKITVFKTTDGKLQVRGLMPGQSCYQTEDGKIHVSASPQHMSQQLQQTTQQITVIRSAPSQPPQPQTVIIRQQSPLNSNSSSPVPGSIIQMTPGSSPGGSQQPLINISNHAMKTSLTLPQATTASQTPPQQQTVGISGKVTTTPSSASNTPKVSRKGKVLARNVTGTTTGSPTNASMIAISGAQGSPQSPLVLTTTKGGTQYLSTAQVAGVNQHGQLVLTSQPTITIPSGSGTSQPSVSTPTPIAPAGPPQQSVQVVTQGQENRIVINDGTKTVVLNAGSMSQQQLQNLVTQMQSKRIVVKGAANLGPQQPQQVQVQAAPPPQPQVIQQAPQQQAIQLIQQGGQTYQIIQSSPQQQQQQQIQQPQQIVLTTTPSGQQYATLGGQPVIIRKVIKAPAGKGQPQTAITTQQAIRAGSPQQQQVVRIALPKQRQGPASTATSSPQIVTQQMINPATVSQQQVAAVSTAGPIMQATQLGSIVQAAPPGSIVPSSQMSPGSILQQHHISAPGVQQQVVTSSGDVVASTAHHQQQQQKILSQSSPTATLGGPRTPTSQIRGASPIQQRAVAPVVSSPTSSSVMQKGLNVLSSAVLKTPGLPISIVSPSKNKVCTPPGSHAPAPTTTSSTVAKMGAVSTGMVNVNTPIRPTMSNANVSSTQSTTHGAPAVSTVSVGGGNSVNALPSQNRPLVTAVQQTRLPTPSKVIAQVVDSPDGIRVILQGISPDRLTADQLKQLQAQVERQINCSEKFKGGSPVITICGSDSLIPTIPSPVPGSITVPPVVSVPAPAVATKNSPVMPVVPQPVTPVPQTVVPPVVPVTPKPLPSVGVSTKPFPTDPVPPDQIFATVPTPPSTPVSAPSSNITPIATKSKVSTSAAAGSSAASSFGKPTLKPVTAKDTPVLGKKSTVPLITSTPMPQLTLNTMGSPIKPDGGRSNGAGGIFGGMNSTPLLGKMSPVRNIKTVEDLKRNISLLEERDDFLNEKVDTSVMGRMKVMNDSGSVSSFAASSLSTPVAKESNKGRAKSKAAVAKNEAMMTLADAASVTLLESSAVPVAAEEEVVMSSGISDTESSPRFGMTQGVKGEEIL